MNYFLFLLVSLSSIFCQAYIPSEKLILNRTVEQVAFKPIYYEQEVNFYSPQGDAQLKEFWMVEDSRTMRLLVRGIKDLQGKVEFGILYEGPNKVYIQDGVRKTEKLTAGFLERWFFEKDMGAWSHFISEQGIIPGGVVRHKTFVRTSKAFEYQPNKYVRLSRVGGVVAYAFGIPSETEVRGGIWIEQDFFNLLKIRTNSGQEVSIEKYGIYLRDQRLPKERTYKLGDQQIQAIITDVKAAKPTMGAIFSSSKELKSPEFDDHPVRPLIEEFYLRYR